MSECKGVQPEEKGATQIQTDENVEKDLRAVQFWLMVRSPNDVTGNKTKHFQEHLSHINKILSKHVSSYVCQFEKDGKNEIFLRCCVRLQERIRKSTLQQKIQFMLPMFIIEVASIQ